MKKKIKEFRAPKGTYDILPDDQPYWEKFYKTAKELAQDYGFQKIDLPLFEDYEL
jgi:histidyl-tRNA synthetase